MPGDWGALFGGIAQSGGRAYESARDFQFMLAQAAYQKTLKEQEMILAKEAEKRATEKFALEKERADFTLEQAKQIQRDIEMTAEAEVPKPTVASAGMKMMKRGEKPTVKGIEKEGREAAIMRARKRLALATSPERAMFPEQFEKKPAVEASTQTDRDRDRWITLQLRRDAGLLTSAEKYELTSLNRTYGEKIDDTTMIDGVSTVDIKRVLDMLYPVSRFGDREGVPEGVDQHSIDFLRHGAVILKGMGNLPGGGAPEIDTELENRYKKK